MHLDASDVYFSHHVASSHSSLEESVAFWAASEILNHLSPSSPCRMRCVPLFWVGGSVKQLWMVHSGGMYAVATMRNSFGVMIIMG